MELTKKHKIIIGGVITLIAGVFLLKKNNSAVDKANLANNTPTPSTQTPTANKTVEADLFKNKINITYEGQDLYMTYNGKDTTGIGFLKDGTEINSTNAVLESGRNYVKRPNGSVVPVPSYFWKMLTVDSLYQAVYSQLADKNRADYPQAIGFLENGSPVYERVVDEMGTVEYGI